MWACQATEKLEDTASADVSVPPVSGLPFWGCKLRITYWGLKGIRESSIWGFYKDYMGILVPHSLLTPSKLQVCREMLVQRKAYNVVLSSSEVLGIRV